MLWVIRVIKVNEWSLCLLLPKNCSVGKAQNKNPSLAYNGNVACWMQQQKTVTTLTSTLKLSTAETHQLFYGKQKRLYYKEKTSTHIQLLNFYGSPIIFGILAAVKEELFSN